MTPAPQNSATIRARLICGFGNSMNKYKLGKSIPLLFYTASLILSGCVATLAATSTSPIPLANAQINNTKPAPTPKQIDDCKKYGSRAWKDPNASGYDGIDARDIEECVSRERYDVCSYNRNAKDREFNNSVFDSNSCLESLPANFSKFLQDIPIDDIVLGPGFRANKDFLGKAIPGLGKSPDFLIPFGRSEWIRSFEGPDPNTTVYLVSFIVSGKKITDYYQAHPELKIQSGPRFISTGLRAFRVKHGGPPEEVTESILPPTPKMTAAQLRHVDLYGTKNEDGSPYLYLDFTKLQYMPVMRWHTEFDPDHLLPESDPAMRGGVGPPHFGFIVWTGKRFELKQRIPVSQWPCGSVVNCAEYSSYPDPKKDKNLIQNK